MGLHYRVSLEGQEQSEVWPVACGTGHLSEGI